MMSKIRKGESNRADLYAKIAEPHPIFGKDSTNHIQNKQVLSEHGLIFAKLTSTFLLKQLISDSSDNRNSVRNNSCKGNVTNRLKNTHPIWQKDSIAPRIIFRREPNSHYRHRKGSVPRHRKPAAGHAIHHARLRGRELVFSGRAAFFDGKRTDGIVPLRFIRSKPYCDGSHLKEEWDSAITSGEDRIMDEVEITEGQRVTLNDNEKYCVFARFCHPYGVSGT